MLTNYVSVEEVIAEVERVGCKWIACRNLTNHPDDWYLKVVYAYSESKREWIVWLYNATRQSLNEGYYTTDREAAREKYLTKR